MKDENLVIVDKEVIREYIKNLLKVSYSHSYSSNTTAHTYLMDSIDYLPLMEVKEL